ncbi:GNAT family N-acetyltransferase [Legionella hackeliae]|uniref:GCN5-related N-acetyltransferase n=2 Tax=Legionella hackeliae TaxID=449 RepID=A0A0A8UQX8_LEGHA|nr:GNAT family N-acetyltransferase [Legionella hackeliae]KTD09580.1 acetyltransferase [Legionella hackeliae]CEK11103.1 GCN5-related N-acetyltransferase [Legionella hackeliae]STX47855.1 acetyltransferase [Legionella hackeliae]
MKIVESERIIIREWREADHPFFATMNSNRQVMEYLPALLTQEESSAMIVRIAAHIQQHGFGLWAAEFKETKEFMGFIGLNIPSFSAHFTPCIEIGWRLSLPFWGKGLATEGAKAVLAYAFEYLGLKEIVSFTTVSNVRSQRVMQKIGMTHDKSDDFCHPRLPLDHSLSKHVLYRITHSI